MIAPGDAVHLDAAGLTMTFLTLRILHQNGHHRLQGTSDVPDVRWSSRKAASLSEYSAANEIVVMLGNCHWVAIVGIPCYRLQS